MVAGGAGHVLLVQGKSHETPEGQAVDKAFLHRLVAQIVPALEKKTLSSSIAG